MVLEVVEGFGRFWIVLKGFGSFGGFGGFGRF